MFSVLSFLLILIYSFLLYIFIFDLGIYDISCASIINKQSFTFVGIILVLSLANLAIGILNIKFEKTANQLYKVLSVVVGLSAVVIYLLSLFGFYIDSVRPPACVP